MPHVRADHQGISIDHDLERAGNVEKGSFLRKKLDSVEGQFILKKENQIGLLQAIRFLVIL